MELLALMVSDGSYDLDNSTSIQSIAKLRITIIEADDLHWGRRWVGGCGSFQAPQE